MKRQVFIVLLIALGLVGSTSGSVLFTVDSAHDTLVRIDTATSTATVVGSLGYDALDVDLAFLDGTLYALLSGRTSPSGKSQLLTVDLGTGAVASVTDVLYGGNWHSDDAEGLGVRDGKLMISFGFGDGWSDYLGELNPATGVIANSAVVTIPGAYYGRSDIDGLGLDPNGVLYGMNGEQAFNETYDLNANTLIGIDWNYGVNDLSFDGGTLYAIGGADGISLRTYDPTSGALLTSVSLTGPSGATYTGLALPEPTSFLLLVACLLIAGRRA